MSIDVMGQFEEVYKNPQTCGHESRICLRNKDMKENVNVGKKIIDQ
jgi:hypothetical protein